MVWLATILAAGTVLLILASPFRGRRLPWMPFRAVPPGGDLFARKEALLRAIKDIEFEYRNGTLSKDDHDVLADEYKRRAVAVMKRLEAKGEGEEVALRDALESEIAAERKALEAR